ncbi:MAG: sugar ABC transporter permease [Anaerolineae bacterium]|nr:sugar ABC transporter permease [Anaerolineae bacterium]
MSEPAAVLTGANQSPEDALPRAQAKGKSRDFKRNNFVGYLFVSPWLIGFFLFGFIPIAISLYLAFTNYHLLRGGEWVGLANFERMFTSDIRYGRAVVATFKYVLVAVPLRLIFALAVALLLNTKRRGVYWFRAAYYIPSVIGGSVAVAVMWRQLFGGDGRVNEGVINTLLGFIGVERLNWFGNPDTAIWTLILLAIWQFGSPMLIFLAGLRQIPGEFYEAASIDGASGWQKLMNVTLPLLTPIIFFNFIMQIISGFRVFTQAFVITAGNPLDSTLFYALYLYRRAFNDFQMGYASAMAWVLLLIIAFFTLLNFRLSRLWVFYETKEG